MFHTGSAGFFPYHIPAPPLLLHRKAAVYLLLLPLILMQFPPQIYQSLITAPTPVPAEILLL